MPLAPSGIYCITNNTNGKKYVGQSQNMFIRRDQHFLALRKGKHENKQMQKDWKTNNRGFRWDVIEYCSLKDLNEREKFWIDKLETMDPKGYNLDWVPYKRKKTDVKRKIKGYKKTR